MALAIRNSVSAHDAIVRKIIKELTEDVWIEVEDRLITSGITDATQLLYCRRGTVLDLLQRFNKVKHAKIGVLMQPAAPNSVVHTWSCCGQMHHSNCKNAHATSGCLRMNWCWTSATSLENLNDAMRNLTEAYGRVQDWQPNEITPKFEAKFDFDTFSGDKDENRAAFRRLLQQGFIAMPLIFMNKDVYDQFFEKCKPEQKRALKEFAWPAFVKCSGEEHDEESLFWHLPRINMHQYIQARERALREACH